MTWWSDGAVTLLRCVDGHDRVQDQHAGLNLALAGRFPSKALLATSRDVAALDCR